jgi:TRAP-type C4-dicarboxylate transport system permease small subunit
MKLRKLTDTITNGLDALIKSLSWVAYGVLSLMVLLVVTNVVGRFLLHKPLLGTVELVELMMVIIAFLAIPYTAVKQGHVRVNLIISRLSRRTQTILGSIVFFLSAAIFGVITYQGSLLAIAYTHKLGEGTPVFLIPFAPFRFVLVLGCLLICLKLLTDVFHPLREEEPKGGPDK